MDGIYFGLRNPTWGVRGLHTPKGHKINARGHKMFIYIVNHLKTKQKTFVFVCLNKQKKNRGQWMRAACQQMDIVWIV